MENKIKTILAVADLFQLAKMNGKFSQEHKTIVQEKISINRSYMEEINESWEQCGKFYVEDEKASLALVEAIKAGAAERAKADEAGAKASKALIDVITKSK